MPEKPIPNPTQRELQSRLARAIALDNPAAARQAIADGADPLLPQHDKGASAIIQAAYAGSHGCLREILPLCDPAATAQDRSTALAVAAHRKSPACVRLLLAACDPNALNERGQNALMQAAAGGSPECCALLLPHCDLSKTDYKGRNALHLAIECNKPQCAALLMDRFDIEARDAQGRTPLMIAAHQGGKECAALLLPRAENAKDPASRTAVHIALERGHDELARTIRDFFIAKAERRALDTAAAGAPKQQPKPKL